MWPIKFRVWDRNELEFIDTDGGTQVVTASNGMIFLAEQTSSLFQEATLRKLDIDEVEILYSTELKDKNGREIYEGDIVSDSINGGLGEVFFDE